MAKDNSAQVAQLFNEIRDQRDAAIAERARYGDMMTEKLAAVEADRIAARALAVRMRRERDEYAAAHEQLSCGHPAAFIAAPAGCDPRCELCAVRAERDVLRDEYRLLVERVKAVMPYAVNTASWVTLLATIGVEPEDMHFSR